MQTKQTGGRLVDHALCLRALLLALFALPLSLNGQDVLISKYIPGSYLQNNLHEVELTNTGTVSQDVSGWFVVTRDYGVRLPAGTRLPPGGKFRMAKYPQGHARLNLALSTANDFLIRLPDRRYLGNYVLLLNAQRSPISGFYHSPRANPLFLPDSGSFLLDNTRMGPFKVPPSTHSVWSYFPVGEDPAIGFEQVAGNWRVISATRPLNLYPAADFLDVKARFYGGTVTLRWNTRFEDRLAAVVLQRSTDGLNFTEHATLPPAAGNTTALQTYVYPDSKLPPSDSVLYYRLIAQDVAGRGTYSTPIRVELQDSQPAVWLECHPQQVMQAADVGVRFYTLQGQQVQILLVDEKWKPLHVLFNGALEARTQLLLPLPLLLPAGEYRVLASTESMRLWAQFSISKTATP